MISPGKDRDPFHETALLTVPRVLGFCDRKRGSATYGCCDRYFWHYRLHDYPNARFQEAAYLFVLAYELKHSRNAFHGRESMLSWSRQALGFWLRNRNRDGSVDETYPYERSFCATSFGLCFVLFALERLSRYGDVSREVESSIRSGEWLMRHDNPAVSNQECAAALALAKLGEMLDDKAFSDAAREKTSRLQEQSDRLGYHPEYGGMDIGYETITLSLLAHLAAIPGFEDVQGQMAAGERTIRGFIDEEGGWDLSRCSRKTRFIYPYGLACLKSPVLGIVERGLQDNHILNPLWMDDRYCINYAIDYLEAGNLSTCS
jgi:hypothetical protein